MKIAKFLHKFIACQVTEFRLLIIPFTKVNIAESKIINQEAIAKLVQNTINQDSTKLITQQQ